MGSAIIVTTAMVFLPGCGHLPQRMPRVVGSAETTRLDFVGSRAWTLEQNLKFAFGLTVWGALGSVLDSLLGGWFQQSVVDTRTGRVIEGEGGKKVLVSKVGQGPNSMHFEMQAELKAQLLDHEGKGAIPKPADSNLVGPKKEESNNKMGHHRYDPAQKNRKPSFGDGAPSRVVESGMALLDNNEVNFLMALTMSLGAMAIAGWAWDVPFSSVLPHH
jgi:uncharacterized membrane protein